MWLQTLCFDILSLFLLAVATLYIYFKYKYTFWARNNVPYLEPQFPFGNTKDILLLKECLGNCLKKIYDVMKKQGIPYGGFYMYAQPNLMAVDPEFLKIVMTRNFKNFQDTGMYLDEVSDPIGAHLIALKGKTWKNLRTKLTPAFSSGKIKKMFHSIYEITKELRSVIDTNIATNKLINIEDLFARASTDIIGSCAFGVDCNSLKNPEVAFRKHGQRVFEITIRDLIIRFIATNFPSFLRFFRIGRIAPDAASFFINLVKQTVEYRERNNIHRNDFLDILIQMKKKDDNDTEGLTVTQIAAHVFVFFVAGYETTSTSLSFCLFELACNQQIQEKTRMEVTEVIRNNNGELTYESLMEMKYLDQVICEVLRKYPPIPIVKRECTEDFQTDNSDYIIKKGTIVHICLLALHRDPDYYPDPEKFDPERFNEEEKAKRRQYSYLPFGEGPRSCIGMRFGLMEAKIILSILLSNYKFHLDASTILPITFSARNVFLSPENPVWLRAEKICK